MDKANIIQDINNMIDATKKYDFPLFCRHEKKMEIIEDKRRTIELFYDELISQYGIDVTSGEIYSDDIWNESVDIAKSQFENLTEKQMINGFYLQELMCEYATRISSELYHVIGEEG